MKVLAIEQPLRVAADSDLRPLSRAEASRVWELYLAGVVRELYVRADRFEAVLVLEAADADDALAALGTLPLVSHGLIAFDVIPLVAYPGFARLFGTAE